MRLKIAKKVDSAEEYDGLGGGRSRSVSGEDFWSSCTFPSSRLCRIVIDAVGLSSSHVYSIVWSISGLRCRTAVLDGVVTGVVFGRPQRPDWPPEGSSSELT